MERQEQSNQIVSYKWKVLFAVNLILGILFWIGLSTDYKTKNLSTDIGFTWSLWIFGLISWVVVSRSSLSRAWKRLFSYFVTPSVIGPIPYLISTILIVSWDGYALSSAFSVDKVESPDHSKTIEVHYLPEIWNIYCGHSYQVSVYYRVFPILRRDLINLPDPRCMSEDNVKTSADTGIEWVDNDRIIVPYTYQKTQVIDIGIVRFNWPKTQIRFLIGFSGLLMLIHGIQRLREKQNGTN